MGYGAAAKGGGIYKHQVQWFLQSGENGQTLSEYDRMDQQAIFVDEAGPDKAVGESCTAMSNNILAWLLF